MGVPRNGFPRALKSLYDHLDQVLPGDNPPEVDVIYVNANLTASGDGRSWANGFNTMDEAFDNVQSGGTIRFVGNIREQLTTPAGVFDVTIIGAGTRPRHADSPGNTSTSTWKPPASPTATTPLLKVQQQGWQLVNFLMDGPSDDACVELTRNALEGADERDASHFSALGMVFANGQEGVLDTGGAHHYLFQGCEFRGLTTGLKCGSTAVAMPSYGQILDCVFTENTNHVLSSMSRFVIQRNVFGKFTTKALDTKFNSGQGEYNIVNDNYFTGDYSTAAYVGAATDSWIGNRADDIAEDEVDAAGWTVALPAA